MGPLVRDEIRVPVEAFPTVRTNIRLFPRVDFLVPGKAGAVAEALSAAGAYIRGPPCVDSLMSNEAHLGIVALPTLGTLKGFHPRVGFLVCDEV